MVFLELGKKRKLFYKIKVKGEGGGNLKIIAPPPRGNRQKRLLMTALIPYDGSIIYPDDFDYRGYPAPYPLKEMLRFKKLTEFLDYCKIKKPNTVTIFSGGWIKNKYYYDLSPFVGRIILPDTPFNADLQADLLAYSGTPIIFQKNTYDLSTGEGVAVLDLDRINIKEYN